MSKDRDQAVIDGIRSAVEAAPDNHALRIHFAELLIDADQPQEALEHCDLVLSADPGNKVALAVAARAADWAGDREGAKKYLRPSAPGSSQPDSGLELRAGSEGTVHQLQGLPGGRSGADVEGPPVTLDDVGGLEHVKRRLRSAFLSPLRNPGLSEMYGKSLRGGLLLWGPPGCGKTFVARATAGELGARFVGIGLHDVLDMWLGESERHLHEIFETARQNSPTVLFFDEIDALGRKRGQLRYSVGRDVVVQFLAELDGYEKNNEGVFILAATNHPWDVDTALRRPGRLDRMLLVLPPDLEAREAILDFHLRGRPRGEIDLPAVAQATEMYSGADLAHVCETAAEFALEEAVQTGVPRPIETADLTEAVKEVTPSTIPWLETARTYAEFAGEGGTYDELTAYLRERGM